MNSRGSLHREEVCMYARERCCFFIWTFIFHSFSRRKLRYMSADVSELYRNNPPLGANYEIYNRMKGKSSRERTNIHRVGKYMYKRDRRKRKSREGEM